MGLLDIANKYSSLFVIVAAITTIATGFYKVRKNMPNGTFRLRKEHTNTLKNNPNHNLFPSNLFYLSFYLF